MAIGKRPSVAEWQGPFIPSGTMGMSGLLSSVITLTPADYGASPLCSKLLISVHAQGAHFTLDGTDPSGTTGFHIDVAGGPYMIALGEDVVAVKVIEESASAVISWQFGQ